MADLNLDAQKAREEIFKNVDGKRSRKQVIRLSVEGLLGKDELKDKSPSSRYNNVCSVLGGVLDALIRDGYMRQDAENATLFICEIADETAEAKSDAPAVEPHDAKPADSGAKDTSRQRGRRKSQTPEKGADKTSPSAQNEKKTDVKLSAAESTSAKDAPSAEKAKGANATQKSATAPSQKGKTKRAVGGENAAVGKGAEKQASKHAEKSAKEGASSTVDGKTSSRRTSEKAVKAQVLKLANEDAKIESVILECVKKEKHTRREILTIVESGRSADKDEAKRLRGRAGQLLSNLKAAGKIVFDKESGAYSFPPKTNEELIHGLSGEEFNIHTQRMLYEWYKKFGVLKDLKSENTDSSGDNGVDCYIKGTDSMGFKEYIIIQSKHRAPGNTIGLKDVREFIGIVAFHLFGEQKSGKTQRPTKFIYSTNAKLTKEARSYVDALSLGHILIIMDGDEWLKKARECGYNI